MLFGPMDEETIDRGRRVVEMAEARRKVSMEQYEADGLPPFARSVTVTENADTPETPRGVVARDTRVGK
jgi:hypothetical protein